MMHLFCLHIHDCHRSFSEVQSRHHRVLYSFLVFKRRFQLINHQFYEMRFITVQGLDFVEFADLAVDTHLGIAAFAHLLYQFLVMTFASTYDRR